ncbi:hypothetical protein [Leptospira brenneri]|uniref:hypothetical protein n=1 Tax=Leptospira brenneri TaxID=2023182 RepID=UPI000C297123|nr:hypothetical protein [Leptospira brenneri]PJZ47193.1 hypothetical protein CH361_02290 [Leptospira brenneri]
MKYLLKRQFHFYLITGLLFGSVFLNIYLVIRTKLLSNETITSLNPNLVPPECRPNESGKIPSKKTDLPKVFSIFIKPHPPNFLEGRQIVFSDYEIKKADETTIVTFLEIRDGTVVKTTVDSEAILWK